MVIHEMSREECNRMLARARLARLACARENQPYVVPVYLTYHEESGSLYGFTTPGQKVEWMRANPLVCVEVDEIKAYDQWVSVIVNGRFEELPEAPESDSKRLRAQQRPREVGPGVPAWSADSSQRQRDGEGYDDEREWAWRVLSTHPGWGEPGLTAWAARDHRDLTAPFIPVYYRIRIDRVTGHEATRDAREAISYSVPGPLAGRWGWLGRTLTRLFGSSSKEASSVS